MAAKARLQKRPRPRAHPGRTRALALPANYAPLLADLKPRVRTAQLRAIMNFATTLPPEQSDLAQQVLKDPYVFDFLTLGFAARVREIEPELAPR